MVNQKIIRWSWVFWLSTIFILSFLPGDQLPVIEWELISIDKLVHFILYFVLAFLMCWDFSIGNQNFFQKKLNLSVLGLYLIVILGGIAIGVFVELIQGNFIYKRYFDPSDIVANGIGTIFGGIMYRLTGRKLV